MGEKPGWEGYLSALGEGIKCILSPVCGLTAQTITGTTATTPTPEPELCLEREFYFSEARPAGPNSGGAPCLALSV